MALPETIRYSEKMQDGWDQFVTSANNGTLFHTRHFLNYHPAKRFKDHSLLFKSGDSLAALLPGIERETEFGRTLISHAGASFGGFVVQKSVNLSLSHDLVLALDAYVKAHRFDAVIMTIPPIFYSTKITNTLEFEMFRNGFEYLKREVSSFVSLDFSPETVLDQFRGASRTAVRRAQKLGVSIAVSEDLAGFYDILQRNLKLRHHVKPTHTLAELRDLRRRFPDQIRLYGAFIDDKMIAGVVMFDCNERVTLAFYISHDERFQQYRAVNLLFYEIFRRSIEAGFGYLDFGIFTVAMDPNRGLARFKENFGSKGIFRDTLIWRRQVRGD